VIRRSFRIGLTLGLLGGLAFALVKMLGARPEHDAASSAERDEPWPRVTTDPTTGAAAAVLLVPDPAAPSPVAAVVDEAVIKPAPAKKAPAKKAPATKKATAKRAAPVKAWVDPDGGVCPTSHPVKAKLASKIFHLPGMLNYERTKPDRCYLDTAKAEADGLRAAKR
jgi:septal ring-binding cell division protein DamX